MDFGGHRNTKSRLPNLWEVNHQAFLEKGFAKNDIQDILGLQDDPSERFLGKSLDEAK